MQENTIQNMTNQKNHKKKENVGKKHEKSIKKQRNFRQHQEKTIKFKIFLAPDKMFLDFSRVFF